MWEIDEDKHDPGAVLHTLGWPLNHKTYGGSFLYHMKDRQVIHYFICVVYCLYDPNEGVIVIYF